ncbi:MAG TPA: glycosyltransferase family 4 protein [Thermoplasmata archaeon]|nr:glycosyltransferase family 4 protein [Thermoplasmata archaeon]
MRIVQVAPFFYPHAGGVESHVRTLAGELAREGHQVTVVTSRYHRDLPPFEERDGYRIVRTPSAGVLFNTPIDVAAGRTVRSVPADVVHLHYPPPLTSFFASRAMDGTGVPMCLTYHCDLFLPGIAGRAISGLYERAFLPPTLARVRRIVVHTRSYGSTSAVLRGRELEIIPSIVDLARFRPGIDASGLRGDLRLDGKRVVAFTGRLVPHKGVDVIVHALRELPPDVVLLVVGAGALLPDLVGLAARVGVADRVRFCPRVADDDLPRYLALAEMFVFPSQNRLEGFGLAAAEAMAMGLPVIVADVPGVREIIEDRREGLLTEPLIASDVARKIRTLLDDPALAQRMGAAGRRRAEARFGLRTVAGQLIRMYEGLSATG